MFDIKKRNELPPYIKFYELLDIAKNSSQKPIDAISISSYNNASNEVECRFVNLKYIIDEEWIFFSNYNSPKARSFDNHKQITALLYWHEIDVQIRIKANICKSASEFSDAHFANRSDSKNALAISSNQSKAIKSYKLVQEKYRNVLEKNETLSRPSYWGGFSFFPYYFEFWQGNKNRINKREVFNMVDNEWENFFLEP